LPSIILSSGRDIAGIGVRCGIIGGTGPTENGGGGGDTGTGDCAGVFVSCAAADLGLAGTVGAITLTAGAAASGTGGEEIAGADGATAVAAGKLDAGGTSTGGRSSGTGSSGFFRSKGGLSDRVAGNTGTLVPVPAGQM